MKAAGTTPGCHAIASARTVDAPDGAAMLVRREAWDTLSPFDLDYEDGGLLAAALALALRAGGWRSVVQPASVVTIPGNAAGPSPCETMRFKRRWATLLSRQPPKGPNAGWRGAARRTLVLVDALPEAGTPASAAICAMLHPDHRVVVHASEPRPDPSVAAGWERLGVEVLMPPADVPAWVREFGGSLDETVSFRAPGHGCPADAA